MEILSQKSRFSTEPSTKGFDNSAGDRWIYPENYPVRDYQFNIVQSALYHNTLVCLPTGLGKTFIAAVVMYNFWRWYPRGKIVFLAPTKPLVAQQINACHKIMGIDSEETIELTGAVDQKKRKLIWSESSQTRVVFATPQIFHKDLEKNIIPTELVKCIVVDEAHKALKKHSYCESIRLLSEKSKYFRVLGLSATPGGKLDAVQDVIRNLLITHLELRDDTSPDIIPYINERKLDIILVGLGENLERFKDRYIQIMDPHVRVLVNNNVIRGNTGNLSKGRIWHLNREWHQKSVKGSNYGQISKTLMILLTMYHAYELMVRHGLRAFYNFYQKHEDKFWLNGEHALLQLLEEINYFLGPFPDVQSIPGDDSFPISENINFGHNKFYKLKELLLRHFEKYEGKEEGTRAIVFVEFRDIVNEVYVLLLQAMPLLRPRKFMGQAGQKQREQKKALEDFRNNKVNVLISTSVGEEGLDVGEVDLIVCFDISNVSPIRLVQRMGRTGRKRDGHIIALVTDGKEHQTLKSSMSRRDSLNEKVLHSSGIISALYKESPRMVPEEFNPECRKTCVTVQPEIAESSKTKTKETKKARKRMETNNKLKNSKKPLPSGSQSMMKFLKRPQENTEINSDNDLISLSVNEIDSRIPRCSQQCNFINTNAKANNVKLLTRDDAAVEFLTLCTMKKSQIENENLDDVKTNPYLPSYYKKPEAIDFDFEIPDTEVLNCLKTLGPCVEETTTNHSSEDWMNYDENYYFDNDDLSKNEENPMCTSRFEALLDCSSDASTKAEFPTEEKVDWAENMENYFLDEFKDEWSTEMEGNNENNDSDKSNESLIVNNDPNCTNANNNSTIKFGVFENLLNEDSEESLENNDSDATMDGLVELNSRKNSENSKEKIDNVNLSSNESETQSDVVFVSKKKDAVLSPIVLSDDTTEDDKFLNDIRGNNEALTTKPACENGSASREKTNNKIMASLESNEAIIYDESIDLLADYEPQFSSTEKRHFQVFSEIKENEKNSVPMISSNDNTVAKTIEVFERTRRNSAKDEFVNNEGQTLVSENARNLFSNSVASRFDAKDTSNRETLCPLNYSIDEKTESEDDIFQVDDFTIDSELEEEINKIEESAKLNSSTTGSLKKTEKPHTFVEPEVVKNNSQSPGEKFDKTSKKNNTYLPKESKKNDSDDETIEVKNNSNLEATDLDFNFQDCDWGSNDFDIFLGQSKASTSRENIIQSSNSRKNLSDGKKSFADEIKRLDKIAESPTSLTKKNSPSSLSLSEKLSRNLCRSFSKERKKEDSPKRDSDSENEFIVSRFETTTISRDIIEDCFAKPNPVSPLKKFSTMNNRAGLTRSPLSLKRNETNKIEDLKKFSARENSCRQRQTGNGIIDERKIGIGRQKSASYDFDTRKRKKRTRQVKGGKRARAKSDFIDDEASVSSDFDGTSESSGNDDDLDNFVSYTQNHDEHIDMQAHYLQTIKSPRKASGFYIRRPKSPSPDLQIYSQPVLNESNDYVYDSFCIDENEDVFEDSPTSDEMTRLEELEMRLRSKKRKRVESTDSRTCKRKRKVLLPASDATSSEDEMEKLRRQIQEESFTLKNNRE